MKAANSSRTLTPDLMGSPFSLKETSPKVLIYSDGSCLKNGSDQAQAGAGVVIMTEDQKRIKLKASYLGALTNQKAEILACAVGLESLKLPCRVQIFSDSKYVVETMKGLNRMKSNRDYWNRLIAACLTHQIEWNWIRGHNGNAFQETADRLSRAAATAKDNLDKITLDRLALMLLNKPDKTSVQMIHNGLKTLSEVSGGAKKADGCGFNKFDSELGHALCWKATTYRTGSRRCQKYDDKISNPNRQIRLNAGTSRIKEKSAD